MRSNIGTGGQRWRKDGACSQAMDRTSRPARIARAGAPVIPWQHWMRSTEAFLVRRGGTSPPPGTQVDRNARAILRPCSLSLVIGLSESSFPGLPRRVWRSRTKRRSRVERALLICKQPVSVAKVSGKVTGGSNQAAAFCALPTSSAPVAWTQSPRLNNNRSWRTRRGGLVSQMCAIESTRMVISYFSPTFRKRSAGSGRDGNQREVGSELTTDFRPLPSPSTQPVVFQDSKLSHERLRLDQRAPMCGIFDRNRSDDQFFECRGRKHPESRR